MNLLFCSSVFKTLRVGPAIFFYNLFEALQANKYPNIESFSFITEDIETNNKNVQKVNVEVFFPLDKISMLTRSWIYARKIKKEVKLVNYSYLIISDPVLAFFTVLSRKPDYKICCFVNDDNNLFPFKQPTLPKTMVRAIYRYLQRYVLKHVSLVIVNSQYLKTQLVSMSSASGKKIHLIYKGVDLKLFTFKPQKILSLHQPISILFVKKDYDRGGLRTVIYAINEFDYQLELTVIGPDKDEVDSILKSLKIRENVNINVVGKQNRKQMVGHYHRSHICCIPSFRESLGVANLEALACGTSVVSTNVGGIPEATDNGKVAWLCEPGSVKGLVNAITNCINHPFEREHKIYEGRRWVENNFNIHKQCEMFIELLDK